MAIDSKIENIYKMTNMQKGMLYSSLMNTESKAYYEIFKFVIKGKVNEKAIEESFNKIIQRHGIFRTIFKHKKVKEPVQVVLKNRTLTLHFDDITALDEKQQKLHIDKYIELVGNKSYDFEKDMLIRLSMFKLGENSFQIVMNFHHIVLDGWCIGILMREWFEIYRSIVENSRAELPAIPRSEVYYEWLKQQSEDEANLYWKKYLDGYENSNSISNNAQTDKYEQKIYQCKITKELYDKAKEISAKNSSTINTFFNIVWGKVLQRYINSYDVVFGSIISGRPPELYGIENMIGVFINTVPIRIKFEDGITFDSLLRECQKDKNDAMKYSYSSFAQIQSVSTANRNLIDHIVVFENYPIEEGVRSLESCASLGIAIEKIETFEQTNYNLNLVVSPSDGLIIDFKYNSKVFSDQFIKQLSYSLESVIEQVVSQSDIKMDSIEVITQQEKNRLLQKENSIQRQYPPDMTLENYFEQIADKYPVNTAVVFNGNKVNYKELNERSNKLAWELKNRGIKEGDCVGLLLERSIEVYSSIIAILKAGGVYVPINEEYPDSRIEYMLKDCNAKLIITHSSLTHRICSTIDVLEIDKAELNSNSIENPVNNRTISHYCYIIYTSGSTGQSKGTLVQHQNVLRVVKDTNYIDIKDEDCLLQLSNYAFDGSVFDIFGALLNGAKLVAVTKEEVLSAEKIAEIIRQENITISFMTTALFNVIVDVNLDSLSAMKKILFGGERVSLAHVKRAFAKLGPGKLMHVYGPTETAVYATWYSIDSIKPEQTTIPIGTALTNTRLYILDEKKQILPLGAVGELYIGGTSVSAGYLNLEEMTKERFLENPWISREKIYRTGDLVKYNYEGEIEFIDRIDSQVKIRGFRIELGEIENEFLKYEQINEATVTAIKDENGNAVGICAYYVSKEHVNEEDLRDNLCKTLPPYMLPGYFIQLDKMPLTANKKIDKGALPKPKQETKLNYIPPNTEYEKAIAKVWEEVLGQSKISINDNFFDLGGHSLNAMNIVSMINKNLNTNLTIKEFFERSSLTELAMYLENSNELKQEALKKAENKQYYMLSSPQKRMFAIWQKDKQSTVYNMPSAFLVEGSIDVVLLEKVINEIIKRHSALHTIFPVIDGKVYQKLLPQLKVQVQYFDKEYSQQTAEELVKDMIQPFDLENGPLVRVSVTGIKKDRQILFIDVHHIISDGVTTGIIVNELAKLFNGEQLEEVKYHYVDYSEYQNSAESIEKIKKQQQFWINQFSGQLPILSLPQDYKRKPERTYGGGKIVYLIENDISTEIKKYINVNKSTSYIFFSACISMLLMKFSGQDEFIIGSPFTGRTNSDMQRIVGMFVNTIALRTKIDKQCTVGQYMEACKKQIMDIFENQDYQFDDLLNQIQYTREAGRNPLFDVMLAMQNVDINTLMLGNTKVSGINFDNGTEKFDITFQVFESDTFKLEVSYNSDVFKRDTVRCMMDYLIEMLNFIIKEGMDIKIEEINALSQKEIISLVSREDELQKKYPLNKTLENYFEEAAEAYSTNTAVTFNGKSNSYGELNIRANQLAWELKKKGIKEGDCVGILLEKGMDIYISIMAVLKAGGVYVPINKDYPDSRIEYMLKDCNAKLLVTHQSLIDRIAFDINMLEIDSTDITSNSKANPENNRTINDFCYIIYTSGSTGQSKGTLVKHENVIRVVKDANYIDINSEDCLLQLSSYAFDGSVFDIFGALLNGAKLAAVDSDTILSAEKIADTIEKENVTISFMTTALFNVIVDTKIDALVKMKKILFGGERVSLAHVKKAFDVLGKNKMLHVYGPTETAVFATYYIINNIEENQVTVPIGTALTNTRLYVLDDKMQLVPNCVAGELYIGGSCVSAGYLNRDELTEERFLDNPWIPCEKIYRTGDLVRFNSAGFIEFLDRIDNQVKIRGFRIELGEIEAEILKFEEVSEAVVTALEDENGNTTGLCAYYVLKEQLAKEKLKLKLSQSLPQYMLPEYYIEMESIPLNANKKIDKRALPKPTEENAIREIYVEPQSELEKVIARVWTEVLGVEKISVADNFFAIGGDSIKGIQIISKLKDKGIGLEIKYLLNYPTIEQLCAFVEEHHLVIPQGPVTGIVPFSPIQRYFLEEHEKLDVNHFCQSVTLFSSIGFEPDIVKKVMEQLSVHHDVLRMIYTKKDAAISEQRIRPIGEDSPEVRVISVKDIANEHREEIVRQKALQLQKSISLEEGKLFKALIIKDIDGEHLYLVIHHFVIDGISWRYIVEDFCKLYKSHIDQNSYHIPPKTSSYKLWVETQLEYSRSERALEELNYWQAIDISEETLLKTNNTTKERTMLQCYLSTAELDADATRILLADANKAFDTNINVLLLSSFMLAVKQWKGMDKLIINLEGHGREDIIEGIDLTRTVGWFTSVYPILLNAEGQSVPEVIVSTNEQLRNVPNNGVVYGMLKYLNSENTQFAKTKPNVCFNYLGEIDNIIKQDEFSISPLNMNFDIGEEIRAMYAMDISCIVKNKKLVINLLHSVEELSVEQVKEFLGIFVETLKDVAYLCAQVAAETKMNMEQIDFIQKQPFVLCLNEEMKDKLFVFPPHMPKIAYSIVYKNLSMYINNYSFYLFNFLETERIVDHYVEKVKELQKDGPYILMGYSFGGALAFEVAYRLVSEGYEVSDIILIDSYVVDDESFSNINLEFVRENVINSLKYQYAGVITNEEVIKDIADSFINYYVYTKDFVNTKVKLPSNLHLIRTDGVVPNIKDTRDEWKSLTSADYIEYAGIGEHNEMLSGANLNHNGKIVVSILNKIKGTED